MRQPASTCRGYSLVELLVVLVIVGVLAIAGISMLGNRSSTSVRSVMDDLEGTLASAHKAAVASGNDILVVTTGEWAAANPLLMAYGPTTLATSVIRDAGKTASESFRVGTTGTGLRPEHQRAGIVTKANASWWGTATTGCQVLTEVPPFKSVPATGFKDILGQADSNLFQGGTSDNTLRINGFSKRFMATFWIQVVSLQNGGPVQGGPCGLIVGLENGATIYKFYNPGVLNGNNGQWRKI